MSKREEIASPLDDETKRKIDKALRKTGMVPHCAITDKDGNHCPGEPKHKVITSDMTEVMLCDSCYINYKDGAYG